ncbi:hypothetical protein GGR50DRAFT_696956 [Xylaria sp. CBS 124048]|nr:hypothetical protein GGR50DRAFT_696956 [Xylaria sp. CBS 124048]
MAALLNFWNSPNNSGRKTSSNNNNMRPAGRKGLGTGGLGLDPRGAKRKARQELYEELHASDDEPTPAQRTSSSAQPTARSRVPSATPASSNNGTRPSQPAKRGIARPLIKSNRDDASSKSAATATATAVTRTAVMAIAAVTESPSRTDQKASVSRPKGSVTRHTQQENSTVPDAHMGALEPPVYHASNTTKAQAAPDSTPRPETATKPLPQDKDAAKPSEAESAPPAKPAYVYDTREEKEVSKILEHRMASEQNGAVELLVQFVGDSEKDATWEAEHEIQEGADEILYEYWKTQGGRINALFHKPKHPPPETYRVFKVLRHERKMRGGFQFEVQWVGHPSTRGETSMETETKLKNIAPALLATYWESVGGRDKFLASRGRAKRSRTE